MTNDTEIASRIAALADGLGLEIGFAAEHLPTGRRVEINPKAVFPTASIYKVPVMMEVLRRIDAGELSYSDRLPLKEADKTLPTGVLLTLNDELQPTLRDLMTLMIIISDNTATTMLLNLVGKQAVQDTMEALGCPDSTVTMTVHEMFLHAWALPLDRPVGLAELRDTARSRQMDYDSLTFARTRDNTVSTAADMTRLMALIGRGDAISPAVSKEALRIMGLTQTIDRIPRFLPYMTVANKTGTFRGLRNDCGIISRSPDDRVAYAIFTFDPTPLPIGNPRLSTERNTAVAEAMGEIGVLLHRDFKS